MKTTLKTNLTVCTLCLLGLLRQTTLADQLWVQTYNGFGGDNHPYAAALDGNGNVVVTGGSANASGTEDIYTAKYAAANGQVLWSVRYESPYGGNSRGTGVAVDSAGNVILTGYSANGNDPNGSIGFDFYTAKYDASGQLLWEHGGPYTQGPAFWPGSFLVKRVAVDGNGDVVISGVSDGLAPCCQWNFYTAKYRAADGQLLWEQWYVGPFGEDRPIGLAVDSGGNVIVTGTSADKLNDHTFIQTIKYSPEGQVVWQRSYDSGTGGDQVPLSVAVDQGGNVFVNGVIENSCCVVVTPSYYIAKYAAGTGQPVWEKVQPAYVNTGGISRDFIVPQSIVVDRGGNAIVNGPYASAYAPPGSTSYNLAKYAAFDGQLIWAQQFNLGDCVLGVPTALALDGADNLVVAGDACLSPSNCGGHQFLTSKYAATDGHLLWQQTFGPETYGPNDPFFTFNHGVAVDHAGNVVAIGDGDTATGNFDFVTLKYTPSGSSLTTLNCPANIVNGTDPNQCSAVVTFAAPTATDVCGNTLTVTCAPASGSIFPKGTTTVNCTASDGSTCSFTVTVNDTEKPVITCPANIVTSIPCGQSSAVVNFTASATDNCPGVSVTCSPPSGSVFPAGVTTVNCTALDASGNASSCSFTVTVNASIFAFTGFLSPVGGADATGGSFTSPLRTFKLNSTIPVKFTAACSGSPVLSGIHRLQVIKYSDQTTAGTPIDATPTDAATTGDEFRLTDSQWQFNLDTKATGMSAGIWLLQATLSDGSRHSAWIQIK